MHTRRDCGSNPTYTENPTDQGFEFSLSEKSRFYLYLYTVCPSIDIIHTLWKGYIKDRDIDILKYHEKISPFQPHPCGNDSLFRNIGFVDPDIFMTYYVPRENYLQSIKMIGHPYFLCQFKRPKQELETSIYYFDTLINEQQIKLKTMKKKDVLELAIQKLLCEEYKLTLNNVMIYLLSFFNMYRDTKVLHGYPIGIDCEGTLCRFE